MGQISWTLGHFLGSEGQVFDETEEIGRCDELLLVLVTDDGQNLDLGFFESTLHVAFGDADVSGSGLDGHEGPEFGG